MRSSAGFSMLELVVTVAILAVLLAIAAPRVFNNSEANLAMAARMIRSDIGAVQRMTMDRGEALEIEFNSDGYLVRWVESGTEEVFGGRFPVTDLSGEFGVEVTNSGSVTFNTLGEVVSGSLNEVRIRLESDSGSTKRIVVDEDTGHTRIE